MTVPAVDVDGPALTSVDRLIRAWRIRVARPHIPPEARLLDVGCHDGALFRSLSGRIRSGVGIDPALRTSTTAGTFSFRSCTLIECDFEGRSFDAITFLAVLEHIDTGALDSIAAECERLLVPGGVVVATIPSPRVDDIVHALQRARLIAGIAAHEHHGADPAAIAQTLSAGALHLELRRTFQLGLNNLFVFRKRTSAA